MVLRQLVMGQSRAKVPILSSDPLQGRRFDRLPYLAVALLATIPVNESMGAVQPVRMRHIPNLARADSQTLRRFLLLDIPLNIQTDDLRAILLLLAHNQ